MVGEESARDFGPEAVGGAVVGSPGWSRDAAREPERTDVVARLERVGLPGGRGSESESIVLTVRAGEIVGVAGVEGNGQHELALVLSGRMPPAGGSAMLPDDPGFIPQDRTREGLIGDFDLAANVALALHRDARWRRGPLLRWNELRAEANAMIARYRIRAPHARALARTLSGGSQQRVVVARELGRGARLLVAENPTRGLDVAATGFVHGELRRLRAEGRVGTVLISTDLDEVLALADRILVMVRGRLVEVPEDERSRAGVGALMLSAEASTAAPDRAATPTSARP
jgi:simple sugar transport system ATP-binding protein